MRAHSISWGRTVSHENAQYLRRAHNISWERTISHENAQYLMRTHNISGELTISQEGAQLSHNNLYVYDRVGPYNVSTAGVLAGQCKTHFHKFGAWAHLIFHLSFALRSLQWSCSSLQWSCSSLQWIKFFKFIYFISVLSNKYLIQYLIQKMHKPMYFPGGGGGGGGRGVIESFYKRVFRIFINSCSMLHRKNLQSSDKKLPKDAKQTTALSIF